MPLTSTFDPHEWSKVYDDADGPAQHHVFRRSGAVATAACLGVTRPGDRWLDIGSGTGHLTRALRAGGAQATGIDHDMAMLRFAGEGLAARVEQLPIADASVDGVVAVSLLGCVADEGSVFRELFRVLKPGGHAVFTCTNAESWLLSLNTKVVRSLFRGRRDDGHFRLYRAAHVCDVLTHAGFGARTVRYYNVVLHAGRWLLPPAGLAVQLDSWGTRRLARNFVVTATKPS